MTLKPLTSGGEIYARKQCPASFLDPLSACSSYPAVVPPSCTPEQQSVPAALPTSSLRVRATGPEGVRQVTGGMSAAHWPAGWTVRHSALRTLPLLLLLTAVACLLLIRQHGGDRRSGPQLLQQQSAEQLRLVDDIRRNYLRPPAFAPYNLNNSVMKDPSRGQTAVILRALHNMRDGFFVECGALDGETRSNTLFMERFLGWTGLLVEADPSNFKEVLSKRRNAWSVNVCLNNRHTKSQVRFKPAFNVGKIAAGGGTGRVPERGTISVDCFPLHALLLALNVTRVDYFSLDVEGAELDVLRTVPFDLLDIRTLSVEFAHTTGGGKPALRSFMEAKGYTVIQEVKQADWTANDFIFVKNASFPELVLRAEMAQRKHR